MLAGQHLGARRPFHRGRLRADPAFALEVGWCADHGLPHSALLEWDPIDRSKLIAHLLEKAARCPSCGTAEWEWDPKQGGSRDAHHAEVRMCMGCYHRSNAESDEQLPPGSRIVLSPGPAPVVRETRRGFGGGNR